MCVCDIIMHSLSSIISVIESSSVKLFIVLSPGLVFLMVLSSGENGDESSRFLFGFISAAVLGVLGMLCSDFNHFCS